MANLWRTQRPRFPLYESDGLGRDYYIKYTNGGYWENQFYLTKKPDYERPRYKNFHSLYHLASPVKYWGDGSGRENYILKCNGFHHDQKPLCSYHLTDFLRNNKNIKGVPNNFTKKVYFSVSEAKYNQKLKNLEKTLVKRLYTEPMQKRKKKYEINAENNQDTNSNIRVSLINKNKNTTIPVNKNETQKNEEINNKYQISEPDNVIENNNLKIKNTLSLDASNWPNKYRNKLKLNYFNTNENKNYDHTYYGQFDHKKAIRMGSIEYISPNNNLKYIDPRGKFNRYIKFKQPSINNTFITKKIKIV